jgi:hypothetical protein
VENSYVYNYITELCKTQAEIIQNLVNSNVHGIGQGEAMHKMYKGVCFVAVRPAAIQLTDCSFGIVK